MENRKGLSEVVSTVLIIMISVAAAAIVFAAVRTFVITNTDRSTECLAYQNYFKFDASQIYNCYDSAKELLGFSVRALASNSEQPNLVNFTVVFIKEDASKRVDVANAAPASGYAGGVRMLKRSISDIRVPKSGELQTYIYNNSGGESYDKMEIYAVLNSGRICDTKDTISIKPCVGVNLEP
jgi:hypothetical protein